MPFLSGPLHAVARKRKPVTVVNPPAIAAEYNATNLYTLMDWSAAHTLIQNGLILKTQLTNGHLASSDTNQMIPAQINGRPAANMTATSAYFIEDGTDFVVQSGLDHRCADRTLHWVWKAPDVMPTTPNAVMMFLGYMYWDANNGAHRHIYCLDTPANGYRPMIIDTDVAGGLSTRYGTGGTIQAGKLYMISYRETSAGGADFFINGVKLTRGGSLTNGVTDTLPVQPGGYRFFHENNQFGGATQMLGTHCEFVMYKGVRSDAEILADFGVVTSRWGSGAVTTPVVTPPVVVTPGVTNSASPYPTGPGGGSYGDALVIFGGQSGCAFFCDPYDATFKTVWRTMDMTRQLTGMTQTGVREKWARSDQTNPVDGPSTIWSGTNTYHFQAQGGANVPPKWMEPLGHTLTDPSTWGNTNIMTQFLAYCAAQKNEVGTDRPIMLCLMMSEYDSRLSDQEIAVYQAAKLEQIKRYRAVMGRPTALLPVCLVAPGYDSGTNNTALKTIRDVWRALALDATNNIFLGTGGPLDATDRGDSSHWDVPSADRQALRLGLGMSHWWSDNGYSKNALTWIPRLGPTFTQVARVSGQSNMLDAIVTHDAGANDLIAPTGSPNYGDFIVMDGGVQRAVTAITKQSANVLRLTLASNLSASGAVSLDYGARTPFNGIASQWTDNWHLIAKPALAATVTDINNVRMILNRYGGLATETAASTGTTTQTPAVNPATQTFQIASNPGTRAAGPWSVNITSSNISSISWVVVNPDYSFVGSVVDVPTNGTITIAPNLTQSNQFVKYWPTGNIQMYKDTLAATITQPASVPAAAGSDQAFAHNFVKNLRLGANLERNNTDFVTSAWLQDFVSTDSSHLRLYPMTNAALGFMSSDQLQGHYDAISRIMAETSLKVLFEFMDVTDVGALNNSGTQPYVTRVCADIVARNWPLDRIAFGHTNEMANAGNPTFNVVNNQLLDLMRQKLPAGALLIQSAGNWGNPDELTNGSLVLGSDKRRIYTWHSYEWDRSNQSAWASRRTQVMNWAAANGIEVMNAEFNGYDQNFNDQAYDTYPAVIDAYAKGAGGGGTIWTFTRGTGWRINAAGGDYGAAMPLSSTRMRPEVKTAMTAANLYIRSQPYFNV